MNSLTQPGLDFGPEIETDPLVCLATRGDRLTPYAPSCGEPLSDHCDSCDLCPGVHAEDCPENIQEHRMTLSTTVRPLSQIPAVADTPVTDANQPTYRKFSTRRSSTTHLLRAASDQAMCQSPTAPHWVGYQHGETTAAAFVAMASACANCKRVVTDEAAADIASLGMVTVR
jgi:hypothetical protein